MILSGEYQYKNTLSNATNAVNNEASMTWTYYNCKLDHRCHMWNTTSPMNLAFHQFHLTGRGTHLKIVVEFADR